jgi:hypothetical protein
MVEGARRERARIRTDHRPNGLDPNLIPKRRNIPLHPKVGANPRHHLDVGRLHQRIQLVEFIGISQILVRQGHRDRDLPRRPFKPRGPLLRRIGLQPLPPRLVRRRPSAASQLEFGAIFKSSTVSTAFSARTSVRIRRETSIPVSASSANISNRRAARSARASSRRFGEGATWAFIFGTNHEQCREKSQAR